MNKFIAVFAAAVFILSVVLGIHNALLYQPWHGFDGSGHVYYVQYIAQHKQIPPPTEWETHQPPLYYIIGATVMNVAGNIKAVQYINIVVLWMIIGMVGLGLRLVFKDKIQVLLGMFSLAALPILNIFPPMVTNELLSTFFTISAAIAALYLVKDTKSKHTLRYWVWLGASLVLGIWTKISIITIFPTLCVALGLIAYKQKKKRIFLGIATAIVIGFFVLAAIPVFTRGGKSEGPTNILKTVSGSRKVRPPLDFYLRLDWIPKLDMYTTQYYSLLGGGWNSFWTDGQNAITPFVSFHKKSLVLWGLGFALLPLSLYGLKKIFEADKESGILLGTIGLSMLGMFVVYNYISVHYSAVRLTYEMAIVVPYSFGIAAAAQKKRLRLLLSMLLSLQFVVLISFYWILPWWYVTK